MPHSLPASGPTKTPDDNQPGAAMLPRPRLLVLSLFMFILFANPIPHRHLRPRHAGLRDRRRVGEARLRLARAQRSADVDWQVGARWFNASDDVALIASASMPLGAARRAQPGIRAAEADLAALEIERESQDVSLYSTLVEAHGR